MKFCTCWSYCRCEEFAFLSTLFDRLVIDGHDRFARRLFRASSVIESVQLQGGVVTAYAGLMWVGLVVLVVVCLEYFLSGPANCT
jgi:hypothetical protein